MKSTARNPRGNNGFVLRDSRFGFSCIPHLVMPTSEIVLPSERGWRHSLRMTVLQKRTNLQLQARWALPSASASDAFCQDTPFAAGCKECAGRPQWNTLIDKASWSLSSLEAVFVHACCFDPSNWLARYTRSSWFRTFSVVGSLTLACVLQPWFLFSSSEAGLNTL